MSVDDTLRALAAPSAILDYAEKKTVDRLCEEFKAFQTIRVDAWIRERNGQAIIESYGNDGTPLKARESWTVQWEELHKTRSGKVCKEWLVGRYFLKDTKGNQQCYFEEPRLLGDKTAWSHFSAQIALRPMARELKWEGITISHHCWDRAIASACERYQRQRHKAYDQHLIDEYGMAKALCPIMSSWFVACGCFAHDCGNALRWSVLSFLADPQVMRATWIVLESLRNSYDLLVEALPTWIVDNVMYEDHHDPNSLESLYALLGLEDAWLHLFTFLQIRVVDGRLFVAAQLANDPKALELIVMCVLHAWNFKTWSTSRWCAVGPATRTLVLCLFIGLRSIVQSILANKTKSKYYIGGWKI